jgi:aspartyl-tRNA(Asn)/glutamyl-tRNA(Gln) amidotransferase subunit C
MKITRDVVEHVAHLGRLELEPEEIELYTAQINSILEYMDQLNTLDTRAIEPTTHAIPMVNVLRDDRVVEPLATEASVRNAPARKETFFKVPPVIEVE